MKYEWKKEEKQFYLPKQKPELVVIPGFQYLTVDGVGNPNDSDFQKSVEVLFSLSYSIKMSPKKNNEPAGYFEFSVYPLEGIWSITKEAQRKGKFDKNDLVYKLMIKQPEFVTKEFIEELKPVVAKKTGNEKVHDAKLEKITDGKCIQLLHVGSFDSEPASFALMQEFTDKNNLKRLGKDHREIYLSDFRRVPADKLKTVLRFWVE